MYEVLLEKGLSEIQFGFRPSQVKSILGTELFYEEWMGGNLENFLYYQGLLIGFKGDIENCPTENSFVCMFQVKTIHPVSIWGQEISQATKQEIESLLIAKNIEYATLSNGSIESADNKLQFSFNIANTLDEVYFAS